VAELQFETGLVACLTRKHMQGFGNFSFHGHFFYKKIKCKNIPQYTDAIIYKALHFMASFMFVFCFVAQ